MITDDFGIPDFLFITIIAVAITIDYITPPNIHKIDELSVPPSSEINSVV